MHSVARVLAVAGLAAVSITCADRNISGLRAKLAFLPIAPAWVQAPEGGPDIDIERVRGVLRTSGGTDSAVAEGLVEGDSAVLEFVRVSVTGDSTNYILSVQAFDSNDVVVFSANDTIAVHAGENAPATPDMQYTAPDANATSVEIQIGGTSAATTNLDWAGAAPGNTSCLNRSPDASKTTTRQLGAIGRTPGNAVVSPMRVGWTSLDPTVATVDNNGFVRAQCSNKSTKIVAKSFLDETDTITINVTAPPFTLLMTPEQASIARGSTQQLQALVVDENGNQTATTAVTWGTSDATKATVSSSGLVTALRNGRVQITATADNRVTVGIIDVVRPQASSVKVIPLSDTVTFGMVRQFVARALDAAGNVIADASTFQWTSSKPTVASVGGASGVATANVQSVVDSTELSATIDGKTGTGKLHVRSTLDPGTVAGVVRNASTDAPITGAQVSIAGGGSVTTNAQGAFSLTGVRAGDDITVAADGFVSITFIDAPAFPNQTLHIDDIPLPPTSGSNGTIQGKVVNAINGSGVSGITVSAYQNLNSGPTLLNPNPTPVATTTTTSSGGFTFANRPAGALTFVASGSGYSTGLGIGIVVGTQTRTAADLILPPVAPNSAGIFAVLSWDQAGTNVPADLDLHITGPTSSTDATRFQIHSGNRVRVTGTDTIATIDLTDATGPGPEVASLRPAATPGLYRFYVKNVSHAGIATSKSLADSSGARVDVFQGDRIIATFVPPRGDDGTIWEVFTFDGARVRPGTTGIVADGGNPNTLPITIKETPVSPTSRPTIPRRR